MKAHIISIPAKGFRRPVITFAAAMVLSLGATTSLLAEETQTLEVETLDADRFQMVRENGTIIRLDKKTGAMSTCQLKGSSLICRMAADERNTLETEIASLQNRLDNISNKSAENDTLEKPKSEAKKSGEEETAKNNKEDEVLDQELDKMVDLSSKVLRRFFSVMKELRDDFAEENSAK